MKFAVAAMIASASAVELMNPVEYKFMEYISQHGKTYATVAEYKFRLNIFAQKLKQAEEHNATPGVTSVMGTNFMSDWTDAEYKKLLGFKHHELKNVSTIEFPEALQDEVNWVTAGAVTPVKDQGQCGSCWSFSTTGALEGLDFVKKGVLPNLSEQQLVDCSLLNFGCNGGSMALAFKYSETHPLESESDYPYIAARSAGGCKYNKSLGKFAPTSYSAVTQQSTTALKAAIAQQPVSVAIEADKLVFQMYKGGVLTGTACGTQLDHGVLAVGYGTLNGVDYYLVKNSWSANWGDQGYVRLGVEAGAGVCGIQMQPLVPTL